MSDADNFALVPRPPGALEKAEPGAKRILSGMVGDTLALANKARRLKVVLVDDDPGLLAVYLEVFCEWSDKVDFVAFDKPLDALAELERQDPDLLITGVKMPKMDGYQLIERLFARKKQYPILVLTSYRPAKLWVEDYGRRGFNVRFSEKPASEGELEKLRSLIGELLQVPFGTIEKPTRVAHPPNALSLTKEEQLQPSKSRFRIGEYEWREPDYRQILMWAEALHLEPEKVIERLLTEPGTKWNHEVCTRFENGQIVTLHWHLDLLRLKTFEWVEGLVIEEFALFAPFLRTGGYLSLSLPLPELRRLHCENIVLTELNLTDVPQLTALRCYNNQLKALDLSSVPRLRTLSCSKNQLTMLSLSAVPQLKELWCWGNQLRKLDLSAVPQLEDLQCGMNHLIRLDLSAVPQLTNLRCEHNQLRNLDLSKVPLLRELECQVNQLTELNLSAVPLLARLMCGSNQLRKLDLSAVPELSELTCYENQITELDLCAVPKLTTLFCYNNQLTALNLFAVPRLTDLVVWFSAAPNTRYCNNIAELDIRSLRALTRVHYEPSETFLVQRPDQNF